MKVSFRTDASTAIGIGHVTRCMSLADALKAGGDSIDFVSRDLPTFLADEMRSCGYGLLALPPGPASEAADAAESQSLAGRPDWWVVDHYALGRAWETAMRCTASRLLAIDDVGRAHDSDLLLDQNLHGTPDDRYVEQVPRHCTRLLGPRYALLRSEFGQARTTVAPRDGQVERVLVFLGGMDADNVTERVLQAIKLADLRDIGVDVVVGAKHPALNRIRTLSDAMPNARCHVQTSQMAGLMARADLAVGAGGTATWERCALGLPTLALCIAENQRGLLDAGSRAGILYVPDEADQRNPAALAMHLRALVGNTALRRGLSRSAFECVDGRGARRVAAAMRAGGIAVRRAVAADCDALHAWRNDPQVRGVSRDTGEIELAAHQRWFDRVLAEPNQCLLVGEQAGKPVGVVRFDLDGDAGEVSIYLLPQAMGEGRGGPLLLAAEAWLRHERPSVATLRAHVREDNPPSQRLFESNGYARQAADYAKRI